MAEVILINIGKHYGRHTVFPASIWQSPTASSSCSSAPRAAASPRSLRMIAGLEEVTRGAHRSSAGTM